MAMTHSHTRSLRPLLALILIFFLGVSGASLVTAQGKVPAWQVVQDVEVSAFRQVLYVPALDIVVPTVVEVPLSGTEVRNKTAVALSSAGQFSATYYKTYDQVPTTPLTVSLSGGYGNVLYMLVDGKYDTTHEFPFVEDAENVVELEVSGQGSMVTTSELRIGLDAHVALPQRVSIYAVDAYGNSKVVLAERALRETVVRFPQTTAQAFRIRFTLAQPLRLAELTLVQKQDVVLNDVVRFLAQPGQAYTLYVDPDRAYGSVQTEQVSLRDDVGVLQVGGDMLENNPAYELADVDKDGVPDLYDNCVAVANADQKDVDKNGRGDACDDWDRDKVLNSKDNCPELPNRDQRDTDGDGVGDVCDTEEDRFTEANPWVPWAGAGFAGFVIVLLLILVVRSAPRQPEVVTTKPDEGFPGVDVSQS
jgi:hypothetical protein